MGNGYFFADMCELYDYCKENVIKEAKAKFGKETVAEDISSEIFYKITEHSEWFFKLDGTKQKDYVEKIKDKVFTKYQKEWEQSYSIKFDEDLYGCKCQHTFVQKVENFFVQLPVLCFSLLSL